MRSRWTATMVPLKPAPRIATWSVAGLDSVRFGLGVKIPQGYGERACPWNLLARPDPSNVALPPQLGAQTRRGHFPNLSRCVPWVYGGFARALGPSRPGWRRGSGTACWSNVLSVRG